jgi:hypothetical protein
MYLAAESLPASLRWSAEWTTTEFEALGKLLSAAQGEAAERCAADQTPRLAVLVACHPRGIEQAVALALPCARVNVLCDNEDERVEAICTLADSERWNVEYLGCTAEELLRTSAQYDLCIADSSSTVSAEEWRALSRRVYLRGEAVAACAEQDQEP